MTQPIYKRDRRLWESQRHLQAARKTVDDFNARFSEELAEIPGAKSRALPLYSVRDDSMKST